MASLPGAGMTPAPAVVTPAPDVVVPPSDVRFVGLITRAFSFAVDAVVINVVATIVGVGAALILSLLHLPSQVRTILGVVGAAAYVLWLVGYFVVFWSTTGQTPGARFLQLRVQTADGRALKPRVALVRVVGVLLAAVPLFAGFLPVLYDPRRRAFQDWLAHTVVVEAPALSIAEAMRARKRVEYEALRSGEPPSQPPAAP
jgi:uncharacterized RDD family membrane protein YckC